MPAGDRWERLSGPEGGTVTAMCFLSTSPKLGHIVATTMAGLFRSVDGGRSWGRVGGASPGPFLTALAASLSFDQDGLILAGSLEGTIFRSTDGGFSWMKADLRGRRVSITSLAMSPEFQHDGMVFAGTMHDGVFRSSDQGATWAPGNFGLLDLNVLDLETSRNSGRENTVFAATTTGIFSSRNAGRVWREADFPQDAAPVQCLARSPANEPGGIMLAGTEASGLFRSDDGGQSWRAIGGVLADECINAISFSPSFGEDRFVIAAADSGLFISRDGGATWNRASDLNGALCAACARLDGGGIFALVGIARSGVCRSDKNFLTWIEANDGLYGRVLSGLRVAPSASHEGDVFAFGPSEGLFQSEDGGVSWAEVRGLPAAGVQDLALRGEGNGRTEIYAATSDGLWVRRGRDAGWEQLSEMAAERLATSSAFPNNDRLIVGTSDQGLWLLANEGLSPLEVPWNRGRILALALSPTFQRDGGMLVAVGHPMTEGADVWSGRPGESWDLAIRHPDQVRGAALAFENGTGEERRWFAAIGDQIYRSEPVLHDRGGGQRNVGVSQAQSPEGATILHLALNSGMGPARLLISTESGVYRSTDRGVAWRRVEHDPAIGPFVALVPFQEGVAHEGVFALELGGRLWRLLFDDSAAA